MTRQGFFMRFVRGLGVILGTVLVLGVYQPLNAQTAAQPSGTGGKVTSVKSETITQGDLYGLVVGVSEYADERIPRLTSAAKDARDFADFLKGQDRLFNKLKVRLLVDKNATEVNIEKYLLYDLLKAGKDDTVVLFFWRARRYRREAWRGVLLCSP